MTLYSVQPSHRIYLKGYGYLLFARNMEKNLKIGKNLSSKYSQNLLDHAKQPVTDALKTVSERAIQKANGDWTCNKIADKNTSLKNFTT